MMKRAWLLTLLAAVVAGCGKSIPAGMPDGGNPDAMLALDAMRPAPDARLADAMRPAPDAMLALDANVNVAIDAAAPIACPNSQNPTNKGFICPTATAMSWTYDTDASAWVAVGPADFSCLGTPSTDTASTVDINLAGLVRDFQRGTPLADASIEVFPGVDFGSAFPANPAIVTGADGTFAATLPTGQTRVGFKVTATDYMDTYTLDHYYDPNTADQADEFYAISGATADLVTALLGITRTPERGILTGSISDCSGNRVSNVIITVSSTSGSHEHLAGAVSYYFTAAAISLPTSHRLAPQTNKDGLFLVIELPEAPNAYLQVWGFTPDQDPTIDPLTLIAEIPSPVVSASAIIADLEPLRQ